MRIDAARKAGLLYLIVVVSGIFSLAYVPSQIPTAGDPQAAVRNILASESLFRAGILAGLVCYTAFLILPLALYRLLSRFGRLAAVLMVALAVVSVPIALNGVAAKFGVLALVRDADAGAAVAEALRSHRNSMLVAQLFWGLWLFPLGWLIVKSAAVPRALGVLLMVGCVGYLVTVVGQVMLAEFSSLVIARWVRLPGSIGEIGTCLWLVVMGARLPQEERG